MQGPPQSYYDRLAAGITFRWKELPSSVFSPADLDPTVNPAAASTATVVQLQRQKSSHAGVGRLRGVTTLLAYQVNQPFLDEICELTQLRTLYLQTLTATDLSGLASLTSLERLVIMGATRIDDLDWAAGLPATLQAFAIENARKVTSLGPLAALPQLKSLAVEGSLHTSMRVATLEPLRSLTRLEYLFLTALRVADKRLAPLAGLSHLRVLEFADYYAAGEIDALAAALPHTRCTWFEEGMKKHRWEHSARKRRG